MSARTAFRLALASLLLAAGSAHALLFRAYLASYGNDANPCVVDQPCRLLPTALAAVADGGEVWMLDSANYNAGTVTIGKSVSILAVPGAMGSISALNGGPAVSISADNLKVGLRNVVIGPVAGQPPGTYGVHMTGASLLSMEDSLIVNLSGAGVYVVGDGTLKMTRTTLRDNDSLPIDLANGARATISSTQMLRNAGGVRALSNLSSKVTTITLDDCVVSGGNIGVYALASGTATARVAITGSAIERTGLALYAEGNSGGTTEVSIGGSLVVDNSNGWSLSGSATILTLGNNQMSGNGSSTGALTPLAGQ